MLREFIDTIPFWWLQFLSIGLLILSTVGAAYLSPWFFKIPDDKEHTERLNTLIAIISGGFSVLLAFIIFNTWNSLLKAQDHASEEANSLAVMMHAIDVFPADIKSQLTHAIRDYTVAVRVQEWKTMQKGKESVLAVNAINHLYETLQSFETKTTLQEQYYSQALLSLNQILKSRRERLSHLNSIIPSNLSSALIFGSFILVVILGLLRGRSSILDQMPVILFAAVLGFNLTIALTFDFPFSGDISVKNTYFYHGILDNFKD